MGGVNDSVSIVYDIVTGAGHLWYLPMLFWCFIITRLLKRLNLKKEIVLLLLVVLSIAAVLPIPLKLNAVFHYLPYFYLGVVVYDYNFQNCTLRKGLFFLIAFLLLLVTVTLYREIHLDLGTWQKIILWYLKQVYATLGTLGLFIICKLLSPQKKIHVLLIQFNACCFGMYIFHQFVLKYIYYKTTMPLLCGTYWLPWIGLISTFIISFGLTWIFRKTKIGRFLLG